MGMTLVDTYKVRLVDENGDAASDASDTLYAGTVVLSSVAVPIATSQAVKEVLIQSDPNNTTDMFVGSATLQPIQLQPKDVIVIPVNDLIKVYAKSDSGNPRLNYLGRS